VRVDRVPASVETYVERLRKALSRRVPDEAGEIAAEIRSHILERIASEGAPTEDLVARVLDEVGDPEGLAVDYGAEAMLRRAASSRSPVVLLTATWRWAARGVGGVVAFGVAAVGYGSGAVCLLAAVLKPFLPSNIGLWLTQEPRVVLGYWSGSPGSEIYGISLRPFTAFVLGTLGPVDGPIREALGAWLYPAAWCSGVVLLAATTVLVRSLIARFHPRSRLPRAAQRGVERIPSTYPRKLTS
jgi:HAAS